MKIHSILLINSALTTDWIMVILCFSFSLFLGILPKKLRGVGGGLGGWVGVANFLFKTEPKKLRGLGRGGGFGWVGGCGQFPA